MQHRLHGLGAADRRSKDERQILLQVIVHLHFKTDAFLLYETSMTPSYLSCRTFRHAERLPEGTELWDLRVGTGPLPPGLFRAVGKQGRSPTDALA